MFKDDTTFNNLCDNLNKLLKPGGYLIFTTMDAELVHEEFQKTNGKIESFYTSKEGTKKKFMHVISKYDIKSNINKTGLAIDFYNSSFQEEGSTKIEYLVSEKFVTQKFKEKCSLELVEAENFQNIYYIFKNFFLETSKYESNIKTREYFNDVKKFYDLTDEVNKASFELARLNKLYVFQKR
jgi:SAM-dependent methyltransferase